MASVYATSVTADMHSNNDTFWVKSLFLLQDMLMLTRALLRFHSGRILLGSYAGSMTFQPQRFILTTLIVTPVAGLRASSCLVLTLPKS